MKTIDFMGWRKVAFAFSAVLLLLSIGSLAVKQLNWGLDFTGGTLVELHYSTTADLNAIRDTLQSAMDQLQLEIVDPEWEKVVPASLLYPRTPAGG